MTQPLTSNNGGLSALVVQDRPGGILFLKPVVTAIDGDPSFPRQDGMGGVRYLRHCLENAFIDPNAIWDAGVIQRAGDILLRLDGAKSCVIEPEVRNYKVVTESEVVPTSKQFWSANPKSAFSGELAVGPTINYDDLLVDCSNQALTDMDGPAFKFLWEEQANTFLNDVQKEPHLSGHILTGLLGKQAWLTRRFLGNIRCSPDSAWTIFHELVSARYIRALCQLHRCEQTGFSQEILWPEITELGRTILLLSCCGWVKEANELTHLAKPLIVSQQNQFVPLVPWFGFAWGAQSTEVLALGAVDKFDPEIYADATWLLENWQTDDLEVLAEKLARIAGTRSRLMGQFDDEYHLDFDDGFSWVVPYEVGAVLQARKVKGLVVPDIDHPLFALPTAQFENTGGPVVHYQDLYADYIKSL